MRATLNISDDLIAEVQQISGEKSKTKAITVAMKEYIKERKIQGLIRLRGKITIDYDWQKEEEAELNAQKRRRELVKKRK